MVRDAARWLLAHGFTELPRKASGHRYFERDGLKLTLPGHGPGDLSKKHVGALRRQLQAAGIDATDFG